MRFIQFTLSDSSAKTGHLIAINPAAVLAVEPDGEEYTWITLGFPSGTVRVCGNYLDVIDGFEDEQ